ncbi:divalent metal cation transporter [Streptomyces sp. AJS327]|uniref:Nramp family divalent metal transporter n=1 Tax=Streptomyces sp. AJS327 TaxID=2545265 RepID=UPI0015DD574E|nr:Nramp family divalent metal transporter [Streptomyces sp. AJS327]MBA0051304.1 divalent metal cation transporter [Streptomyces sp. AJS327]
MSTHQGPPESGASGDGGRSAERPPAVANDPGAGAGSAAVPRQAGGGGGEAGSTPTARKVNWKLIGPGIVVAATGVGAGDLVATLVAGSKFGYTLLWAAVLGCVVKIALAEAVGRFHLATGRTLFDGWRSLGPWTTVYFAIYVVIWGFVYGATAMSSSALPLQALFPGGPDLKTWGVITGLLGLLFVWFNHYAVVEKVLMAFVGVMFVVVVYVAIRVTPHLGDAVTGLVPTLPDGSVLYTLTLIGGVGGTITMAAYGYWVNAKGWTDSGWMRMMRVDNRVAYVTTGIFVVAMLVIGAELLHSANIALTEDGEGRGLLDLDTVLEERFGEVTSTLFLVGFFAASFSSLVGVWHGVSLMFSDFVERARLARKTSGEAGADSATAVASGQREGTGPFRAYLLWLTFPPMALLWLDKPIGLIITYGVLGAFFMPFLALTLVWLLNTSRTPRPWRNGPLSNGLLTVAGLLFLVLSVHELTELDWSWLG